MFFFGNLSAIFPYLLYIFIVWICILIGSRGQFLNGLFTSKETAHTAIIDSKEINSEENYYIVKLQVDEDSNSLNESIFQKQIFILFNREIGAIKYHPLPDKIYEPVSSSGYSLRGPPTFTS
jgi:hypothetical protein